MNVEKKLLKIRFEILVESVTAEYKSPFTFKIMFKKGGITCESLKQFKYINGSRTDIKVNEKFNYNTHILVQLNDDKKDEISEKIIAPSRLNLSIGCKVTLEASFGL